MFENKTEKVSSVHWLYSQVGI